MLSTVKSFTLDLACSIIDFKRHFTINKNTYYLISFRLRKKSYIIFVSFLQAVKKNILWNKKHILRE